MTVRRDLSSDSPRGYQLRFLPEEDLPTWFSCYWKKDELGVLIPNMLGGLTEGELLKPLTQENLGIPGKNEYHSIGDHTTQAQSFIPGCYSTIPWYHCR